MKDFVSFPSTHSFSNDFVPITNCLLGYVRVVELSSYFHSAFFVLPASHRSRKAREPSLDHERLLLEVVRSFHPAAMRNRYPGSGSIIEDVEKLKSALPDAAEAAAATLLSADNAGSNSASTAESATGFVSPAAASALAGGAAGSALARTGMHLTSSFASSQDGGDSALQRQAITEFFRSSTGAAGFGGGGGGDPIERRASPPIPHHGMGIAAASAAASVGATFGASSVGTFQMRSVPAGAGAGSLTMSAGAATGIKAGSPTTGAGDDSDDELADAVPSLALIRNQLYQQSGKMPMPLAAASSAAAAADGGVEMAPQGSTNPVLHHPVPASAVASALNASVLLTIADTDTASSPSAPLPTPSPTLPLPPLATQTPSRTQAHASAAGDTASPSLRRSVAESGPRVAPALPARRPSAAPAPMPVLHPSAVAASVGPMQFEVISESDLLNDHEAATTSAIAAVAAATAPTPAFPSASASSSVAPSSSDAQTRSPTLVAENHAVVRSAPPPPRPAVWIKRVPSMAGSLPASLSSPTPANPPQPPSLP